MLEYEDQYKGCGATYNQLETLESRLIMPKILHDPKSRVP